MKQKKKILPVCVRLFLEQGDKETSITQIVAESIQFGTGRLTGYKYGYGTAFGGAELLPITKSDADYGGEIVWYPGSADILKDDTVFFLSAEEVRNADYGFTDNASRIVMFGNEAGRWWLRSRYLIGLDSKYAAGAIGYGGDVGDAAVNASCAARPAVNMKTDNILFISAIGSGKLLYYGRIDKGHDSHRARITAPSDLENETYTLRLQQILQRRWGNQGN